MIKRWTKIEDCPIGKSFLGLFKKGIRFKIARVYVHVDDNFLQWRNLRPRFRNGKSIIGYKCIFYLD